MTPCIFHIPAILLAFHVLAGYGCSANRHSTTVMIKPTHTTPCSEECTARNKAGEVACKLTSAELQQRKETVITSLKKQIIETKELSNGYAFRFPGTDEILDELTEFIKTERACCGFFVFRLSVSGDQSEAWLELTGAEGAKDFILSELGLVE